MGFDATLATSQRFGNFPDSKLVNISQYKDFPFLSGQLSAQAMKLMPEFFLHDMVQGIVVFPG